MTIIEKSLQGDTAWVENQLEADPTQINAQQKFTILDGQEATLTPLFAAAVAGHPDLVKTLVERGATLSTGGDEDLFTWTCLCPDRKARGAILDHLTKGELLKRIHPGLGEEHVMVAQGKRPGEFLEIGKNYPLNFVQTSLLSGTFGECQYAAKLIRHVDIPSFRGMRPLALKTYRVAMSQVLNRIGFCNPALDLYEAAAIGDLETIKRHLPSFKDLFLIDTAVMNGQIEVLKYLRESGRDLDSPERTGPQIGWRAADFAAVYGRIDVLEYLGDECGIDLDSPIAMGDQFGWRPIHFAASNGQIEVLRLLRDRLSNFNQSILEGPQVGWSLAEIAVKYDRFEVLRYLQNECGIDLTSPIKFGPQKHWRPVDLAADLGQVQILNGLVLEFKMDLWPAEPKKMNFRPLSLGAKHPDVLRIFGFEEIVHEVVYGLLKRLPDSFMHLVCLTASKRKVEELIYAGFSPTEPIKGQWGDMEPYQWVFVTPGPRRGPLTLREHQQIETLRYLFSSTGAGKKGVHLRKERLRKEAPRLYREVINEAEQVVEEILIEKELLRRVLAKTTVLPEGKIVWRQGNTEMVIPHNEVVTALQETLDSLLSKNQVSGILGKRQASKLTQLLAIETSTLASTATKMDQKECLHFCAVLEALEKVSSLIIGGVSELTKQASPTVTWHVKQ